VKQARSTQYAEDWGIAVWVVFPRRVYLSTGVVLRHERRPNFGWTEAIAWLGTALVTNTCYPCSPRY
jgi:hypothetical protein